MADGYRRQRVWYGDKSTSVEVTTLTGASTLVTCRAQNQLCIQVINVVVSGVAAGKTWDIQDSVTGLSVLPNGPLSTTTATTVPVRVDFGANGLALTPLANLVFVPSATGAAGSITVDAYQRLRQDVPITP